MNLDDIRAYEQDMHRKTNEKVLQDMGIVPDQPQTDDGDDVDTL